MVNAKAICFKFIYICCLFTAILFSYHIDAKRYLDHQLKNSQLIINSDEGEFRLTFLTFSALEVFFKPPHRKQLPSYAISAKPADITLQLKDNPDYLLLSTKQLTVRINKQPLQFSYYKNGKLLASEDSGFFIHDSLRGVRFKLDKTEKILGGGERVVGMDRRGLRLPLYNKAHYGYSNHSTQMNYSLPAIMSTKKYLILFDNSAKGFLDIGKSERDILQFEALAGRTSYVFVAGDTYPQLIENYVDVTGKQPLPPRWAFGNFASRFGYHSEQEARDVVSKFKQADIPLDAIIFDLYWFGKNIQGYMGNLAWDKKAFPTPIKMISDFNQQGVKTILITEPFVLTNVHNWQDAVDHNALALNLAGKPKSFDFYFGHTSLIDVFSKQGQDWFWQTYDKLLMQGVAGWWGDLGEPEVHPSDTIHSVGSADEIHNAYGHKWAEMIFTKQLQRYPDKRPFILMRSGFAGSQRFGMIPWTGDVSRSWGGLKSQIELTLQMSLFGLAYTHSDLGGFAGDNLDDELYLRWLQYGVFQPIYRPHAQESVPSEPIFRNKNVQNLIRKFIKLRYQLLPYNYTLAYQNSLTGMPLMRPLFLDENSIEDKNFDDGENTTLIDNKKSYFWGDAFFIAPITDSAANTPKQTVKLPQGMWFDFFSDEKYQGNQTLSKSYGLDEIPVFVRAGAFVPMINDIANTQNYSSAQLNLHYYADDSVKNSSYQLYEDDGKTYQAQQKGLYELLNFSSEQKNQQLTFELNRELHKKYEGMPEQRVLTLTVHHWQNSVKKIIINNKLLTMMPSLKSLTSSSTGAYFDKNKQQLTIKFLWYSTSIKVQIN